MNYKKSFSYKAGQVILYILLTALCISIIFPVLNVVAISFSDYRSVARGEVGIWPVQPTLNTYKYMLQMKTINSGFINSVIITVVGTAINMLFTSTMAYALAHKSLIGKKFFMGMVLFTMMFSGGLIPTYLLLSQLKLIDTLWSVMLPGAISAYNLIVLKNFFQSVPEELKESARIDGLSEIKILWKIVIPLAIPAMCTIALFYAVGHWNDFFGPCIYLNNRSKWPLQVVMRDLIFNAEQAMSGMQSIDQSGSIPYDCLKMAVIVVTTVPIAIVYPFLIKYFKNGVMVGSVKG